MLDLGVWEDDSEYDRSEGTRATGAIRHRTVRFKTKDGSRVRQPFGDDCAPSRDGYASYHSLLISRTSSLPGRATPQRAPVPLLHRARFRRSDGLRCRGRHNLASPSVKRLVGHPEQIAVATSASSSIPKICLRWKMRWRASNFLAAKWSSVSARHHDGRWIFVEGNATILPAVGGRSPQVVFNWRDVTQRKLDEERLRNIERRLRDIISHAPVVVNEFDADGIMTMAEGDAIPSIRVRRRGNRQVDVSSCSPTRARSSTRSMTCFGARR